MSIFILRLHILRSVYNEKKKREKISIIIIILTSIRNFLSFFLFYSRSKFLRRNIHHFVSPFRFFFFFLSFFLYLSFLQNVSSYRIASTKVIRAIFMFLQFFILIQADKGEHVDYNSLSSSEALKLIHVLRMIVGLLGFIVLNSLRTVISDQ